jgi:hypothetical protein
VTNADRLRSRYQRLKAERRCVDCTAGLQDGDGVRCIECAEESRAAHARYAARYPSRLRKRNREKYRARYEREREEMAARMREWRMARKATGLCMLCIQPALDDSNFCDVHREQSRIHSRNHHRRKRGEKLLVAPTSGYLRGRRLPTPRGGGPQPKYRPMDEQLGALRLRLLRALRWLGWSTAGDLFERAVIEQTEETSSYHHLRRLVDAGAAERRGTRNEYEYRITNAGRCELEQLLVPSEVEAA